MTRVRPVVAADAERLGAVHVRAWQAAYRGLMPDAYLDALSVAERAQQWRTALVSPAGQRTTRLVSEDEAGCVVAFTGAGPAPGARCGEIYVLNVDPSAWGHGHGRALLGAATEHLAREGFDRAVLWVHPGNSRARRFYEAAGWATDGTQQTTKVFGIEVPELRYLRSLPPWGE